jgi:hypothetical protein
MVAFKLHVKLSWGEEREYLLANDVEPGLEHRYQTRENWQEVMQGALINVPVGPYIKDNRAIPPMATAKVLDVVACKKTDPQLQRTRSQFIMAAVWQKQSDEQDYNYMHHDYPKWSQRQIKADVDYWNNGTSHPFITLITKWRIWLQRHRQ